MDGEWTVSGRWVDGGTGGGKDGKGIGGGFTYVTKRSSLSHVTVSFFLFSQSPSRVAYLEAIAQPVSADLDS